MDRIKIAILLVLMTMAGCSKGYDPEPPASPLPPRPTLTLERLHALYRSQVVTINEEMVVKGRVTTSDRAGNFYRTLCIEAEGYALEVLVGSDQLHSRYPLGSELVVNLEGLTLAQNRSVLQAGRRAADYQYEDLEYLEAQPLIDKHLFRSDRAIEKPRARQLLICELKPELCGSLVCITGLRWKPQPDELPTLEGYHRFRDRADDSLHLYVSSYARFANLAMPEGEVALRGILQYLTSGDHAGYLIKPRDEEDTFVY